MPQVVVQVKAALATSLREHFAGGAPQLDPDAQDFVRVADELGLRPQPVFSSGSSAEDSSLFSAAVSAGADLGVLTDRLRQSPAVESVFVKPDDSPP